MAKLNRESKLRERKLEKQARKIARKQASLAPEPDAASDAPTGDALTGDALTGDALTGDDR